MKNKQEYFDEQDTASLVASTLAGDPEAFGILFQRHAPSVQRLCTRLLGRPTEAQDIVQEAALQAFLGLSHLREPARFAAWFQAIAANLAHSALRRRREDSLQTLETEMTTVLGQNVSSSTLEEYLFERETQKTMLQAIQQLPLAQRQAIIGFYLQGYHYNELAEQFEIPVSTLKWRLFEGRKRLKAVLQPSAEARTSPRASQHEKELSTMVEDMISLSVNSLQHLPFTRSYQAILRDSTGNHILPVSLSEAEFCALDLALRIRQDADMRSIPQDLAQRLLESFGAQTQHVVIHRLVGQTLYATASFKQGARLRAVDMRLAEALVLAVREDAPISITRTLFETGAVLDQSTETASHFSEEEMLAQGKTPQTLGREERLQWEEAQRRYLMRQQRVKQRWERLWSMLLTMLADSPERSAELGQFDFASTFPISQVTWQDRPMTAIRLFDQEEASWLFVPPPSWDKIEQQWLALCTSKEPREGISFDVKPFPTTLTPQLQQQADALLTQLTALPEVRSAALLNPTGKIAAWQGAETQENMQRYCQRGDEIAGPLMRQKKATGMHEQKFFSTFYPKQQTSSHKPVNLPSLSYYGAGWRLLVIFEEQAARKGLEALRLDCERSWQRLMHQLSRSEKTASSD